MSEEAAARRTRSARKREHEHEHAHAARHPFKSTRALALVASLAALVATSCAEPPATAPLTSELALRDDLRQLWAQDALWTRVLLIDTIAGLPDADAARARLLRNRVDIGDAIRPFYGDAAADELTALLRRHVAGLAVVIDAAKTGDRSALARANTDWYDTAHELAAFLAGTSPQLALAELDPMMRAHAYQTGAEAVARVQGDWMMDVAAHDLLAARSLELGDALSAAISRQFPDQVTVDASEAQSSADHHRAMRSLWQDQVSWTRVLLVSSIAGLPDAGAAQARLLQNAVDIGRAVEPFFGEEQGDTLASLLQEHVALTVRVVLDLKRRDTDDLVAASDLWYANGDRFAAFFAAGTPSVPLADARAMMGSYLDHTLAQANARLVADWPADIAAFDRAEAHVLHMSDELGDGMVAQLPQPFSR